MPFHLEVQHYHSRDEIASGDGLQRIGIYINIVWVEAEQVALHHHSQEKQYGEALRHLAVDRRLAAARQHFAERKRNRRAADKKEERHHQVPEAEARPRLVVELEKDSAGGGRVYLPQHGTRHRLQEYQQKEVKAPQNV